MTRIAAIITHAEPGSNETAAGYPVKTNDSMQDISKFSKNQDPAMHAWSLREKIPRIPTSITHPAKQGNNEHGRKLSETHPADQHPPSHASLKEKDTADICFTNKATTKRPRIR
jgi:hypothetical protein